LGDYTKVKEERDNYENKLKDINNKLNTELKLGLEGDFDLDTIIKKVKKLIAKPDNLEELIQANQTIADLKKQLTNKEITDLEEVRQASLKIFKDIAPRIYSQFVQPLKEANSFQKLNQVQQEAISAYAAEQETNLTQQKDELMKQRVNERVF